MSPENWRHKYYSILSSPTQIHTARPNTGCQATWAIKYIHEVSNKIFFLNDTSDFIRQKLFLWQSYDQGFAPKFPENHNTSKNDLSIDRLHSPQQKSARKFISNQYCISFFKVIIIESRVKVPTCHTISH